jgi:two-component system CheB/CheR fusion protein
VTPIRDAQGQVRKWVGSGTDVHETRELLEALRRADQRKDEFLAVLAHELRNPLAPLRNGLELLRLANGDSAATREARAMMERQVGHLVRLIDDLLDTSRIASGKLELRKMPMDVVEAVRVALETSRPLLASALHEVRTQLPDEPLVVEGDPVRLAQVFSNLLNNSARYTGTRGHVGIEARVEGNEVVVAVEDDGRGIPAEMLERVFEPFTQVDSGATRMHGGLGLGLALARRLVELHGGSIHAESAGPGRGSRFVVRLPAAPNALVVSPESPSPGHRIKGLHTLVVDDNDDAARSLAMLLKTMGHEVRVANDGESGLRMATVSHPDLVILDIGMPGMDGYEVARRLRASNSFPMTIIALSGYGQEGDRQRSREAGIDAHVVKPLEPGALEGLIAALRGQSIPDN